MNLINNIESYTHTLNDGRCVVIREATINDAAQLILLVRNILSTTPFTLTSIVEFDTNEITQAAWVQEYIDNPNWIILVAECEGQLVANLDFRNNLKRKNRHSGEFGMGVHEDFRGKGIGSAILNVFLEWAKSNPIIEKINLSVMSNNLRGVQLYTNIGFKQQGLEPKAIKLGGNEYADVVNMYLFV